jgi:DNA-binding response OmpR family regulator
LNSQQTIRLAVIDTDSGFLTVLAKRAEAAGWQLRQAGSAVPPQELVAMKLNAVLIDPAVLGDEAWDYLERVSGMLPDLGLVVCTGRSTVAQRVRGLRLGVDDWVTKPCHPEEVMARVEAVSRRRRRGRGEAEAGPLVAGEMEIRPDQFQAFVGGESCWRAARARFLSVRPSTSASGATRWLTATARSTSSSASSVRS